jgi:hydroxymethylpyrimidine pyrophosphatase-like HAD family hydrolase
MRYAALACDYDGTLAHHGSVDDQTIESLERVRASGRKLLLVTGRQLDDLIAVFPRTDLFDRIVAENGALLYRPATKEQKPLSDPPPDDFFDRLQSSGIAPLSRGHVIVATWEPHQTLVLEVIREMGLELQVIFNKGAVMVLPAGVNKASGLKAALDDLGLSPHNTAGVGDAENDHAFLSGCECAVAVANALPGLKERADVVTQTDHGAGVVELIENLVDNDLQAYEPALTRHHVLLGRQKNGQEVRIPPYAGGVLVAGPSGAGKSTAAVGLLERLAEQGYQFCLIDPEGDYEQVAGAVTLGENLRAPGISEIVSLLRQVEKSAIVKLYGMPLQDRPVFFSSLLPRLHELRAETGRPHWVMVDEAHHLLPAAWDPAGSNRPRKLFGMLLITVHPESLSPAALEPVEVLVAIGPTPSETFQRFGQALNIPVPEVEDDQPTGEATVWFRHSSELPVRIRPEMAAIERRRHRRKYAEGELGPDRSFYFRGPEGKLNLRARNLMQFVQIGEGVDEETWIYHLRNGDYSEWVRTSVKDQPLADEIERIEKAGMDSVNRSRERIREEIEQRYTGAA